MKHRHSMDAVRLVWPQFGRRKVRIIRSHDGLATLKRRAFLRAASICMRPLNALALIISLIVLFAGENAAAVPYIVSFGLLALILEKGAEAPKRRREARIIRDVRPLLLNALIELPETKRAGRILRVLPKIVIPDLPPDRPRTRISERRGGPDEVFS